MTLYPSLPHPALPNSADLWQAQRFYEDALCWLGRPKDVYRLLSEAVFPPVSSWVRGNPHQRSFNSWQVDQIRTYLYPVVTFPNGEAEVLCCEALLLCGDGNYYNPCDVAICVFVQQPQEHFSQLLHRLRQAEAAICRGPNVTMTAIHVSLAKSGQDYINTKYLVWPHTVHPAAAETLVKQGISLVQLSTEDTSRPFLQESEV